MTEQEAKQTAEYYLARIAEAADETNALLDGLISRLDALMTYAEKCLANRRRPDEVA